MARKRTPTKQVKNKIGESQSTTSKSQDLFKTVKLGQAQRQTCSIPIFLIVIVMCLSIITAAVCYKLYPDFTNVAAGELKAIRQLRQIIEPEMRKVQAERSDSGQQSRAKRSHSELSALRQVVLETLEEVTEKSSGQQNTEENKMISKERERRVISEETINAASHAQNAQMTKSSMHAADASEREDINNGMVGASGDSGASERLKLSKSDESILEKTKESEPIILNAENSHLELSLNQMQNIQSGNRGEKSNSKNHNSITPKTSTGSDEGSVEKTPHKKASKVDTKNASTLSNSEKTISRKERDRVNGQNDLKKSQTGIEKNNKFKPAYQRTFTPKKIFHAGRRIAPVELLHQKTSNSSVKAFLFDDFLSEAECDGLIRAHKNHVEVYNKPPILCFDSIATLRQHIHDVGRRIKVTPNVFTPGTRCVNATFSLKLQNWLQSNWSYSTAFYPGESKFSTNVANRMQQAMGLKPENGGKFQITSYPLGKAYKTHTDCTLGNLDKRDRVVSVLMYLNDAEDGGETEFPDLGIWVKPKKGRAIVWNNMDPTGYCEPHSRHAATLVRQGKKYILIRWYYYKSFPGLGHRPSVPELPAREEGQALVSCDEYNSGSCRWYDEWTYEHLLEYQRNKANLT